MGGDEFDPSLPFSPESHAVIVSRKASITNPTPNPVGTRVVRVICRSPALVQGIHGHHTVYVGLAGVDLAVVQRATAVAAQAVLDVVA